MIGIEFKQSGQHSHPLGSPNNVVDTNTMHTLATLSKRARWILYTAECQRPNAQTLHAHNIDCGKVVQLKASKHHSEAEIIAKAITYRTASAIVASSAIDHLTQQQLSLFARQHDCALFFIKPTVYPLH